MTYSLKSILVILFTMQFMLTSCEEVGIVNVEPPIIKLSPPQEMMLEIQNRESIALSWKDNSLHETGYLIERKDSSDYRRIAITDENASSYIDTSALYACKNHYRVSAIRDDSSSAYSIDSLTFVYLSAAWSNVPGGDYRFGEAGDLRDDIQYDYDMMTLEVTTQQFVDYLHEGLKLGTVRANISFIYGFYEGDSFRDSGDVVLYELRDSEAKIDWNGELFTIIPGFEENPVTEVSWYGAYIFAKHYSLDLPTEQEWEKAARGDSQDPFPWGSAESTCDLANIMGCGAEILPVGSTQGASPFGILDLSGNAWEWVAGLDDAGYPDRALKGGACRTPADNSRVFSRSTIDASHTSYFFGFRCIRK